MRKIRAGCGLLAACLLLCIFLAACGLRAGPVQTMPVPQTPEQGLFEAETNFDLALKQAEAIPLCSAGGPTLCLKGPQMAQVYTYAVQGTAALDAAKAAVAAYDAAPTTTAQQKALAAVAALAQVAPQIVALLPKQGG